MIGWIIEATGWIGLALNIWGNFALTKKSIKGWLIRLACNGAFLVYTYYGESWALFWNHIFFAGINVYGWLEWSKDEDKYICGCGREWYISKATNIPAACICELPIPIKVNK